MNAVIIKGRSIYVYLKVLLIILTAVSLIGVFSSINVYSMILEISKGNIPETGKVDFADSLQQIMGVIHLCFYIPMMILFLFWYRSAYINIEVFGQRTEYKKSWAIGGFFVPILHFVRPYTIGKEIINKSTINETRKNMVCIPLLSWWILFVLTNYLGRIVFRMMNRDDNTINQILTSMRLMIISDILNVLLFPTWLVLIALIIKKQDYFSISLLSPSMVREDSK